MTTDRELQRLTGPETGAAERSALSRRELIGRNRFDLTSKYGLSTVPDSTSVEMVTASDPSEHHQLLCDGDGMDSMRRGPASDFPSTCSEIGPISGTDVLLVQISTKQVPPLSSLP